MRAGQNIYKHTNLKHVCTLNVYNFWFVGVPKLKVEAEEYGGVRSLHVVLEDTSLVGGDGLGIGLSDW